MSSSSSSRSCSVAKCSKSTYKRGYCLDHYQQHANGGAATSVKNKMVAAGLLDSTTVGCDDMVLLPSPSERTITENLQMRHKKDLIYTYIGQVLISVNPFKMIKNLYSPETIQSYSHKASHENPPHVFALAEMAYMTMKAEEENQCVIISGESGAGTVHTTRNKSVWLK